MPEHIVSGLARMTVAMRAETAADDAFVRQLILETVAEELGAALWPEPMRSHLLGVQCAGRRHDSYGPGRIISADGVDAGWVLLSGADAEIFVVEIMVLPELRSRGIGTAALRKILAEAFAQGRVLQLNVSVMNLAAIRLYERLGFRRIGGDEVQHFMEASRL